MTDHPAGLSDFDYPLPESLIAQKPAEPRDHSRLLVYDRKTGSITDDFFYNLARHLPKYSVLVLNNSRVEKARLLFGNKEVFITRLVDRYTVEALIRPGKAFKKGRTVTLTAGRGFVDASLKRSQKLKTGTIENHPESIRAEVLHVAEDGLRTLRFNYPANDPVFDPFRRTPFPPYIRPDETLAENYQTIYAREEGSKAAPTAGLHFTDRVFNKLADNSIDKVEVTLHVGLGTFAPVKTEHIHDHKMHSEWFSISPDAAEKLGKAEHITAVGTTSARVLESITGKHPDPDPPLSAHLPFRDFQATKGETNIFITPGYRFRAIDALITNFHLPKSTLLMMIAAFTGIDEMHRIYTHAIRKQYRFYSFGDAMLLL